MHIQGCHMKADVWPVLKMWWFLLLQFFNPGLWLLKVNGVWNFSNVSKNKSGLSGLKFSAFCSASLDGFSVLLVFGTVVLCCDATSILDGFITFALGHGGWNWTPDLFPSIQVTVRLIKALKLAAEKMGLTTKLVLIHELCKCFFFFKCKDDGAFVQSRRIERYLVQTWFCNAMTGCTWRQRDGERITSVGGKRERTEMSKIHQRQL